MCASTWARGLCLPLPRRLVVVHVDAANDAVEHERALKRHQTLHGHLPLLVALGREVQQLQVPVVLQASPNGWQGGVCHAVEAEAEVPQPFVVLQRACDHHCTAVANPVVL